MIFQSLKIELLSQPAKLLLIFFTNCLFSRRFLSILLEKSYPSVFLQQNTPVKSTAISRAVRLILQGLSAFERPFHRQIIQVINHFERQIIRLRSAEGFFQVAEIIAVELHIVPCFVLVDAVFPNQIQETARRELPRINHVNIEKIEIAVLIARPIAGRQTAVGFEFVELVVFDLRIIMPCAKC